MSNEWMETLKFQWHTDCFLKCKANNLKQTPQQSPHRPHAFLPHPYYKTNLSQRYQVVFCLWRHLFLWLYLLYKNGVIFFRCSFSYLKTLVRICKKNSAKLFKTHTYVHNFCGLIQSSDHLDREPFGSQGLTMTISIPVTFRECQVYLTFEFLFLVLLLTLRRNFH